MTLLANVRNKAKKIWETHSLQQAYLVGEGIFPMSISLPKISTKTLQHDFSTLRLWIKELNDHSKERIGHGYQVGFKNINHRLLGCQLLPTHTLFLEQNDFLRFINKTKEYQQFCQTVEMVLAQAPKLKTWLSKNPAYVSLFQHQWPQLLHVCHFMRDNPSPKCYLRELDIPDVDTKWIEQHKKILSALFEQLLPVHAIHSEIINRGTYYFEKKYGFKHDEQLIRFRVLDEAILVKEAYQDTSIPLSHFKKLSLACRYVFITENKINGLSFPTLKQAMVIFGLGYGIQSLRDIAWLKEKNIIYWGDIDTHGFAMLSQLRSYYPQTKSLLMDEVTLKVFEHLWVKEPPEKRCTALLKHLLPEEQAIYQGLQNNVWGENIRLEQERISFHYFCERVLKYI